MDIEQLKTKHTQSSFRCIEQNKTIDLFINYFCEHHLPRFKTLALDIKLKQTAHVSHHFFILKPIRNVLFRVLFLISLAFVSNRSVKSDVYKIIYEKPYCV